MRTLRWHVPRLLCRNVGEIFVVVVNHDLLQLLLELVQGINSLQLFDFDLCVGVEELVDGEHAILHPNKQILPLLLQSYKHFHASKSVDIGRLSDERDREF